ncbi:hypothetical protein THITH_09920 [Thioalkalivibrio paradoxus ARh 1]|uniref:Uncharacterized protein n=1 Tax=Thioalkalivibrio paradoxus ARh 1 TaxID=713585 RepID=W0DS74_9GAMM|nr:hypothetical protein THITH_09920 [Thioalkalivibrio paradoxus ARh 1]
MLHEAGFAANFGADQDPADRLLAELGPDLRTGNDPGMYYRFAADFRPRAMACKEVLLQGVVSIADAKAEKPGDVELNRVCHGTTSNGKFGLRF